MQKETKIQVALFGVKTYDIQFFEKHNTQTFNNLFEFHFFQEKLNPTTAILAQGYQNIVCFVNDRVCSQTIQLLAEGKDGSDGASLKHIAMRCAGYDNVNLDECKKYGIRITRVPDYSPYAVSEHAMGLILALARKIPRAFNRVREGDFSLNGLLGFDLHGKTVGIIGMGKIGYNLAKILSMGMGCKVLAYDVVENEEAKKMGIQYISNLDDLWPQCDIISLHVPSTPKTKYMINQESIQKMKSGVMLINTSRGELLDTKAVIQGLKNHKIGYLGLDVYEHEGPLFFEDKRDDVIQDDLIMRLTSFPNVIVTSHQAYFTKEALSNICFTTLQNIQNFSQNKEIQSKNLIL